MTIENAAGPVGQALGIRVDARFGAMNRWDYTNGVILSASSVISEVTGDPSFFE